MRGRRRQKLREDLRFLTGSGTFVDDIKLPNMLHMAVLKSPYAHAKILSIDAGKARKLPGVRAVATGRDALRLSMPLPSAIPNLGVKRYCLATDRVRYSGEPVVAVAADDRYTAADALDLIHVEYETLPVLSKAGDAFAKGASLLHESLGTNVVFHQLLDFSGDIEKALNDSDFVIEEQFRTGRNSGQAMETFGCVADSSSHNGGSLNFWSNFQYPANFNSGFQIPFPLRLGNKGLNFVQDIDIGGSFGNKTNLLWLTLCGMMSGITDRPVKFVETRSEHSLAGDCHTNDRMHRVVLGYNRSGRLRALKLEVVEDVGAYPYLFTPATLLKPLTVINGQYEIRDVSYEATAVCTNKAPVGAYRGFGAISATFTLERMIDRVARNLNIDPAELRMRNFIRSEEFPYLNPTGERYDSGNYEEQLRRLLRTCKYEEMKRRRDLRRGTRRRRLGIGLTTSVEPGMFTVLAGKSSIYIGRSEVPSTPESMVVSIDGRGKLVVSLPFPSSGQGHETYVAQLFSAELGIDMEHIAVRRLDTSASPPSVGPAASRLASVLAALVYSTAEKIKAKLIRTASQVMGVRPEDLVYERGSVHARGAPTRKLSFRELCWMANKRASTSGKSGEGGLDFTTTHDFRPGLPDEKMRLHRYNTMSSGDNLALVEVDIETGVVEVLEYWVVHDCGTVVNALSVEGQVIGGIAQGIEHALFGEFVYDEDGQLLNPTLMDFPLPAAADLASIRMDHMETPSPETQFGIKGVGEGGILWAPSAIVNAVEDALKDLNVRVNEIPITPEALYKRIRETIQA